MKTFTLQTILFLALCGAVCAEQTQQQEQQLAAMFAEHKRLIDEQRFDEALMLAKRAMEIAPEERAVQALWRLTRLALNVSGTPNVVADSVKRTFEAYPHHLLQHTQVPYREPQPALHFLPPQPYIEPQFSILPPQPVCRDESINLGIYGFMHVGGLTDDEVRNAAESYLAVYWERATAEVHAQVEHFLNQRRAPQPQRSEKEEKIYRFHYVGDITDVIPAPETHLGLTRSDIMSIIQSVIEPDSWMSGDVYMDFHYPTRSLGIRQTGEIHTQIEDLLGQLRDLRDGKHPVPQSAYLPPVHSSIAQQRPESERQILRLLDAPIAVSEYTIPLEDALKMLTGAGIPYHLDIPALLQVDVQSNVLVRIPPANDVKLRSILNTILDPLGLTYVVKHEMLVITSKRAARGHKLIRMYYVGDLDPNFAKMMDMITSVIDPDSWIDGDASVQVHHATQSLAIRQFEDNHALIEDLLGTLREINDKEQMASVSPVAEQTNPRPLTLRERMRARAMASPIIPRQALINRTYR